MDGDNQKKDEDTFEENIQQMDKDRSPPNIQGEADVSGSMPDPESDDDTLENAHEAGLQRCEDLEHPKEIDIGRDINTAEDYQKTH